MTTTKTQMRGQCQCCGADQAVLSTGFMAKHGYTVKNGWFNGVCSGQCYMPMQTQRTHTDHIVQEVRKQCVEVRALADAIEAGKINPPRCKTSTYDPVAKDYVTVPYAEATPWQQREQRKSDVWKARSRAKAGEQFADDLTLLADLHHGTPLRVVEVEGPPPAILIGERRQGKRVLECIRIDKGRVYWKDEKGFKGWTGTQAWRKLAVAA